ncbi:MAG: deoxyguanosinetriphosphate triphosphohydrolase [Candidatus Omnitrophota bacterium]|nr:deoxyguanosinetriphosphate triphosphohydrolase [Candidatus Omnitrophota bacterium]MBU1929099.1 deoxyguanosinetriphosphate triphosphohydrolase [Candidatus Omnitrophota bacterium]MBU1929150.1 deoxyguanosinetriphosphate triphosphohydrolase [Candidatus Omnitrophota bacterium]MBU2035030.1 deoxyguanosinetriphosphate triphosphohydrolase [Candidatus Omnitrophota bacterium]MBU2222027.1 deoxyguanosinetriphosphate triphosphohydrolase [Candidatus Omnitrophota bacterium]
MSAKKQIFDLEESFLAPYAMKSVNSKGRVYPEEVHSYRSPYQRDRDRVIHSAAFRRLEYKTQVFVNHEGDYYRTRLTHTIEVAQIARTIAYALRLNFDLTEAIALAHDLGHTPFGHSGEDALNELMSKFGGFNHNLQGLRVVDILEERYPDFPGLNLSWEVREGIVKHSSAFDIAAKIKDLAPKELPTLETQIVDIADEIAYDNHDIDDGITSGLLKESDFKTLEIWNNICKAISSKYAKIDPAIKKYLIIRSLINIQVTDLIQKTQATIDRLKPKSHQDVKSADKKIVSFSPRLNELRLPLRDLLINKLYRHYRVVRMSDKAKRFIKELFEVYISRPQALPSNIQKRIPKDDTRRAVCDYIAGMTDRYALDEYKKLFDPYEKV